MITKKKIDDPEDNNSQKSETYADEAGFEDCGEEAATCPYAGECDRNQQNCFWD